MTEKLSCPHCEVVRDVELVQHDEQVTIKGREITFKARFHRCLHCGTEFEMPGQLDANLDAAREAYSRLYEAPTPEQLVQLRGKPEGVRPDPWFWRADDEQLRARRVARFDKPIAPQACGEALDFQGHV